MEILVNAMFVKERKDKENLKKKSRDKGQNTVVIVV